jgi:PAS domain S-box-containing protein
MINSFFALDADSVFQILQQSKIPTAIYTGSDVVIQLANDAMLKLWGKNQSVLGNRLEDAIPELAGQPFIDILKKVWKTGETYEAYDTAAALNINGEMVISYFDFVYQPIFTKNGELFCIMHTAADVTNRVKAWSEVHEKEQYAEEINKELTASNEKLQSSIEELATLNEEYTVTNEQLDETYKIINSINEQLATENIDLRTDNKDYQDNISNLDSTNKGLLFRNKELRDLNDKVSRLNNKLSESYISFKNLIAQAPVAIMLVKGENFIITMINDAMLEIIGKDYSIIGKKLFTELPELAGQPAADMLVEAYNTGKPQSDYSNPVLLNRNGKLEKGYFNFNYTPFIENGKVTGVIDMAVEVTPQALAIEEREAVILEKIILEETLRKSEQRLQGILETMAEGVGVVDANGKLVYANPMAQQILGLTESTIKERTFDDPEWHNLRIDGTELPPEEHPMAIMMATGKPVYDHEIAVQPPGKERIYISINAAPLFNDEGQLTGGIGTFMDVTTRRMIMQGKEDFISIASHEIKTPVTSLKATLQLLQRSNDKLSGDSRIRLLDQSIKSLDKLSALITSLLDTSRIENGQLKMEKRPFAVSELFDDCSVNFSQITQQNIIFEGDTQQIIIADSQQIGQVMINFIGNALKYAPESKEIIVKAKKISDFEIKISVKDEGPGIPEEKLEHLFDRYYRTNYHGQKFSGLGLGLFISADIIKKHGGAFGVNSAVGRGSEFWFTLPI